MRKTAIVYDPQVKAHDPGPGHPEQIARVDEIVSQLQSGGLLEQSGPSLPRQVTDDELSLVHTRAYLDLVEREIQQGRRQLSTGDTDIASGSAIAARAAVGCALAAVDGVMGGAIDNAFCVVRPPGHHAGAAYGMGFCLYNTVAIAARYAQSKYAAERIAIIDWDVHHGNGTQDIFYRDPSVLFFSTHQSPLYPGTGATDETGEGQGTGTTINHPFPAGAGRSEILGAFNTSLRPALDAFHPDLILISSGFDSRQDDLLGRFTLTDQDFRDLTAILLDLAGKYCQGRIVSVLEGGYNIEGMAFAAEAHVRELMGLQ